MSIKRIEAIYLGRVQGVGFRFTAEELAIKYGIKGYVRNLPNGGVEVAGEGEEKELNDFLADIKRNMGQYIAKELINWPPPAGSFNGFDVRY